MRQAMHESDCTPWLLWPAWIGLNAIGWEIGRPVGYLVYGAVPNAPFLLVSIAAGAAMGLIVGLAQWLQIRRLLPEPGWWIMATAFGWAIGNPLGGVSGDAIAHMAPSGLLGPSVDTAVIALAVGALQWLTIRTHSRYASIWVLASTTAGAAVTLIEAAFNPHPFLAGALDGAAFGAVTGATLAWLLRLSQNVSTPAQESVS